MHRVYSRTMWLIKPNTVSFVLQSGNTALILSSRYGHSGVVKTLSESGASVNEKDKDKVSCYCSLRIMYILRNYCRVVLFGCHSHYNNSYIDVFLCSKLLSQR